MMQKLKMHTKDLTWDHITKIRELFPNCVTETKDAQGRINLAVDFDSLRQELSGQIVEGSQERYVLNWPGKREALLTANAPIAKTFRPARDESVDFDTTKNLFIEGDNLEALKLLQETYLGKVKMIYIDPPYNTGKDFIYRDNFAANREEYEKNSGQRNEEDNRLVANTESNGRFHSDWLSFIYPRLKLARNLLRDDGVIFISIDDNEQANLKRLCDEIFGEENFRNSIAVKRGVKSLNSQFADDGLKSMNIGFENILIYAKSDNFLLQPVYKKKENFSGAGTWQSFYNDVDRPTMRYDILGFVPKQGQWRWQKSKAQEAIENYRKYSENYADEMSLEAYWESTGKKLRFIRRIKERDGKHGGVYYWLSPNDSVLRTTNWIDVSASETKRELEVLSYFSHPKAVRLIKKLLRFVEDKNSIALDFFAGSCTTADAVMQLNAEDGGKRRYIMVQLPEKITDEKSEAYRAGYKNIAEISKERIRSAGKKIRNENPLFKGDIGFRVLKIDTSNMADIYYTPDTTAQKELGLHVENIKEGRTPEDLLFQVLLDWGVDLTLPITREKLAGKQVYFVDGNALAAFFEIGVSEDFAKELAARKLLRVVFRDNGFTSDAVKINVGQIFKQLSPSTEVRSI